MRVWFWGTRGSIPVALTAAQIRHKLVTALKASVGRTLDTEAKIDDFLDHELGFAVSGTFGGHSSCVELIAGGPERGNGPKTPQTYHVFMSHVHWDHIMGFPFFAPVYIPGNRIVIHGCHEVLEAAFRRQQAAPSFPVDFSQLAATIEFVKLEPGRTYRIGALDVTPKLQRHEGDSYGYRVEAGGKVFVYSTDSEHRVDDNAERLSFVEFFRNADLVVFDAMYALADAISVKADWGHSSNIVGVELCQAAAVRRLCMFHHEPAHDDERIDTVLHETRRFEEITRVGEKLEIASAYDGLEIEF